MKPIASSELIINPNGSIYHLHLQPEEIAPIVLMVGDPQRVEVISSFFDTIELKRHNREIITHTGSLAGKRISVMSTGMGTDNIDIVVNELDALVNMDFEKRCPREKLTSLTLIRIGTSGSVQAEVGVNSFIISEYGIGIDSLLNFYKTDSPLVDLEFASEFVRQTSWNPNLGRPFAVKADPGLLSHFDKGFVKGLTVTAPGFYGPQGRLLRAPLAIPDLNERIMGFEYLGRKVTNFEMETSAIYGLSAILGHRALTCCLAIANRATGDFNPNYKVKMEEMIMAVLQIIKAKDV